jgi:hypothetical protein
MKIKSKKQNKDGFVRLETEGEIKEILINEDFLKPNEASIALCYRGKESSGIIELSPREIEKLIKSVQPKLHLMKDIKLMKFNKE